MSAMCDVKTVNTPRPAGGAQGGIVKQRCPLTDYRLSDHQTRDPGTPWPPARSLFCVASSVSLTARFTGAAHTSVGSQEPSGDRSPELTGEVAADKNAQPKAPGRGRNGVAGAAGSDSPPEEVSRLLVMASPSVAWRTARPGRGVGTCPAHWPRAGAGGIHALASRPRRKCERFRI